MNNDPQRPTKRRGKPRAKRDWTGRLVRVCIGEPKIVGRVFRVVDSRKGRLELGPPQVGFMLPLQAEKLRAFALAKGVEVIDPDEGDWCRVCGCTDENGCGRDVHGHGCSWFGEGKRLCDRCATLICRQCGKRASCLSTLISCDNAIIAEICGKGDGEPL